VDGSGLGGLDDGRHGTSSASPEPYQNGITAVRRLRHRVSLQPTERHNPC
jgi:hypothetical protein